MQFWLSYNNEAETFQLPVNPQNISISSGHNFNDVQVSKLGEFTIIGEEQLKQYDFSSFFPKDYQPMYCEYDGFPEPWQAVKKIEEWQKSGNPVSFKITSHDETQKVNTAATIRSFNYEEKAGSPGDIYFTISLKEFKFLEFQKVEGPDDLQKVRPNNQEKVTTYIVKSGDSLWKIAQKTLGNGSEWRKIYDANVDVIGPNENLIYPKQKLVIP
ncbi:LysM peptidoglycan-binding domain-containing protein [Longirhabdus pacifica]|uniref:LysM peptidoglycan-binding domain-containing protein n=1 Tax=Longirhabdus pacifica TaxID=2305227 RepID=UPI00100900CC|nr:LysM peptidoglycan-binding domain-containing protein [Longirhabdus pacifica]